jgi:hypothetical protein
MRIYVASSWRNEWQPRVVQGLLKEGYVVYNFRNPEQGSDGFHWSNIDTNWKKWSLGQYIRGLKHPIAEHHFSLDWNALLASDLVVMVLPCGRSAHLEAGVIKGAGKPLCILIPPPMIEPELMYKMADKICGHLPEVIEWLKQLNK